MAEQVTLVLGGARGGKSRFAMNWARGRVGDVLFVATARALDDDMRRRIDRHRDERPAHWRTLEAPFAVGQAVEQRLRAQEFGSVVVDCLTMLAANAMLALPTAASQDEMDAAVLAEVEYLLAVASASPAAWLLVTNEVGMGVVPPTALGRAFQDALGRANQHVATAADNVLLLVAGLPWVLKGVLPR